MTKPEITQSQKRFQESVGALFNENRPTSLFIKSSTDMGVIRNGGRNGARFAPRSFLSTFKKFSQDLNLKEQSFLEFEVGDEAHEKQNFHEAQLAEATRIEKILKDHPGSKVCHIGGGHDHIYPLLRAYSQQYKKIVVLNIDAHADTRTDTEFHSGTPFRQFSEEYSGEFHIFQIGLHPFANSFSTLSPLSKGKSVELWRKDLTAENLNKLFKQVSDVTDDKTLVVFSLDADALNGFEVPGVSAVNPAGISRAELLDLWKRYVGLKLSHAPVLGVYELNPLYDSLAAISMRNMASFVFEGF